MNMQNSAAEEELRCVLAGTLMKVAPLLSQRWGKSVFCLRTCLGVEENRKCVK